MIQVASSFSTEPSLDVVLSSIPARIYEAVHFLQENMDTFTAKVRRLTLSQHLLNFPGSIFVSKITDKELLSSKNTYLGGHLR